MMLNMDFLKCEIPRPCEIFGKIQFSRIFGPLSDLLEVFSKFLILA